MVGPLFKIFNEIDGTLHYLKKKTMKMRGILEKLLFEIMKQDIYCSHEKVGSTRAHRYNNEKQVLLAFMSFFLLLFSLCKLTKLSYSTFYSVNDNVHFQYKNKYG